MTLYDFDFVQGTNQLNYRGKDRVAQCAQMMQGLPFPLVIERTPRCPELAMARRLAVLDELGFMKIPIHPEQVIVGIPRAFPLNGQEAELIYQNLLHQTESRGESPNGSTQSSSGASSGFAPSTGFGSSGSGSGGSR
ncbi:MAG: hypothetical protein QM780_00040 [Hyphomicrobium sp.]|uniref:hypothetical protein n=1 Tax=Hyphomicrobium sp. TaxID=82 RepID=UPI0039E28E0B